MWRSVLYALRNALVLLMAAFLVTPVRVSAQDTSEQAGKTQPDGSLPSLQTCIRELRDWRSNWGTIRISSHEWNLKDMAECNPDADPNAPDYIEKHSPRYEFAWANWGALRHKYTTIQAGKVHSVTSRGTNTEYSWKGSHVFEAPQDAPLSSSRIVVPFHGLWFARPGCWLDRELEDNPWTVLGWEDVDGHGCVKI